MWRPTDGGHLAHTDGESSPTLGASSASVSHGCYERSNTEQRKKDSGAPLPGAPNVGYRVPAKPLRFELWGAREDYVFYLSVSQGSRLLKELHKRHKVYTGLGHRCGVIPYSSVVWWIAL